MNMNVERKSPLPGLNEKCFGCRKQLKDGPFESGFPCKAAWAPGGYPFQPKRDISPDGTFTCDSYRPKWVTHIKSLVGRASMFAASRGIQLPQ